MLGRAWVLWLLHGPHAWVSGDVHYFASSLAAVPDAGLGATLVEYPLPGVAVIALPWLLAALTGVSYAATVVAVSLAADAAFAVALHRYGGPGRAGGLAVWVLAVPLLGATVYARFDLAPGVLAGAALLLLARRPAVSGGLAALAVGLKLWPALVVPALLAPRALRTRALSAGTAVGLLLLAGSVLASGVDRLVSPLGWQAERGLQIESVAATPAMVGWVLAPERFTLGYSAHKAYEVTGPGVDMLVTAAGLASLAMLPALVGVWVLAWRRGDRLDGAAVTWLALAAVSTFVVTSKVLSPQYLLWLLPLTAAGLALAPVPPPLRLRVWAGLLLVATGATQVVFPQFYDALVNERPWRGWVVLVLVVRNLLLVLLAGYAAREAVRAVLSGAGRSSARRPGSPGAPGGPAGDGPTTPAVDLPAPKAAAPPDPGARRSARPPRAGSPRP